MCWFSSWMHHEVRNCFLSGWSWSRSLLLVHIPPHWKAGSWINFSNIAQQHWKPLPVNVLQKDSDWNNPTTTAWTSKLCHNKHLSSSWSSGCPTFLLTFLHFAIYTQSWPGSTHVPSLLFLLISFPLLFSFFSLIFKIVFFFPSNISMAVWPVAPK